MFDTLYKNLLNYKSPTRFWIGPKLYIAVYKPRDVEAILTAPAALEKADFFEFIRPWLGDGLLTAPVTKWKPHRKIILPAFNQKILDSFIGIFNEQSAILVKCLKKELDQEEFDILEYVRRCTYDIFCG